MRCRAFDWCAIAVLLAVAGGADARETGLVQHVFKGGNFQWERRLPSPASVPDGAATGSVRWDSAILSGRIEIPETGDYVFSGANRELLVFDGRREREGQDGRAIRLEKGPHAFERWISYPRRGGKWTRQPLQWRTPGADGFARVPAGVFSFDAADLARTNFFPSAFPMTCESVHPAYVRWMFDVPETGFYRLCIRRAGNFRWGNLTAASRVDLRLDGVSRREFHTVKETAYYRDDERLTFCLAAGRHTLEAEGEYAERYQDQGPRLWWRAVTPDDREVEAVELTQEPAGESVFRRGDRLVWTVRRPQWAKRPLEMTVRTQRTSNVVWRTELAFAGEGAWSRAELPFTCDREGVFEYTLAEVGGETVEGPWQFLVIDTTPVRKDGSAAFAPPVCVDTVDLGREQPGDRHAVRDDGTSRLVQAGPLAYRQSGRWRGRWFYGNTAPKETNGLVRARNISFAEGAKLPGTQRRYESANWFGFTLRTKKEHLRKTHLAVFTLPADRFRRFPIQLIDPQTGASNGASVEIPAAGEAGATVKVSVPFWPNVEAIDVLMIASSTHGDTRQTEAAVAKVELQVYPDGLPPLAEAACGWNPERLTGWRGEQGDLSPERTSVPPLWDGEALRGHVRPLGYWFMDYTAYDLAWRRYAEYAAHLGCNWLCWPIHSYRMTHLRTDRMFTGGPIFETGFDSRDIDRYRRTTLKIILLMCEKYGIDFYGDTMVMPNVPKELVRLKMSLKDYYEKGVDPIHTLPYLHNIVRMEDVKDLSELEGAFLEGGNNLGGNFNPVHPIGRRWLIRLYGEIAAACRDYPAFKGMNLRQWNACSTALSAWWGSPLAGYDDYTLKAYRRETGAEVPLQLTDVKARQNWLLDDFTRREKWFRWRAEKTAALQKDILAEMRRHRADCRLQVYYHHGTGTGPWAFQGMGADESMMGRENGYNLARASIGVQGNECNQLDPIDFWNFDVRPGVAKLPREDKAYFKYGTSVYPVGLCTAQGLVTAPDTTRVFAEALAKGPLEIADFGMFWAYPAGMDHLRDFLRAYRAIPSGDWRPLAGGKEGPFAALTSGKATYYVNLTRTPRQIRLQAQAEDLVSGAETSVVDLAPWGLALFAGVAEPQSVKTADRIGLTVANPRGARAAKGVLATFPVGQALARGGRRDELRLLRDGRELPLQIDRRDSRGNYVPRSEPETERDEVAFLVDFADSERAVAVDLVLRGPKRKDPPSPFAVGRSFVPGQNGRRTNVCETVKNDSFEVWFSDRGVNRIAVEGKTLYDDRGSVGLLWDYRSDPLTGKQVQPTPFEVYAAGPVRYLAGWHYGPPKREWAKQFRTDKAFPSFEDATWRRVWQIRRGSRTLEVTNQRRYRRAYVATEEYHQWPQISWCDPQGKMEPKRVFAYGQDGAFVESSFTRDPKLKIGGFEIGGTFGPVTHADALVYWQENLGAGLAFSLDRSMVKDGYRFERGFAVSMCNMHVPEEGGYDLRLAVKAVTERPTQASFDDDASLPPVAEVMVP